jgi:hypothetical protein
LQDYQENHAEEEICLREAHPRQEVQQGGETIFPNLEEEVQKDVAQDEILGQYRARAQVRQDQEVHPPEVPQGAVELQRRVYLHPESETLREHEY